MKAAWLSVVLACCLMLGCETAPKTPRQYFAASYQAVGATADALADLGAAGVIQPDDALVYLGKLEQAKGFLDEGKSVLQCRDAIKSGAEADAKCGPASMAQSKAALASAVINQVQQYVAARKVK